MPKPPISIEATPAPQPLRQLFEQAAAALPGDAELRALWSRVETAIVRPVSPAASLGKAAALLGFVVGGAVLLAPPVPPAPIATEAADARLAPRALAEEPMPRPTRAAVEPTESPAREAPAAAIPTARQRSSSSAKTTVPSVAVSEADLLEQARGALTTSPSSALALAEEHRRTFPAAILVQEREVIAIQALRRLGENEQARRRHEDFARRFPTSAHARTLDSALNRRPESNRGDP